MKQDVGGEQAPAAGVPDPASIRRCAPLSRDGLISRRDPHEDTGTAEREAAFRAALDKRMAAAAADHPLTTVEKQALWACPGLPPSPVMVWLPEATGAFLDTAEAERLLALVAYCGLRRAEVAGLAWSEVDLDQGVAYILETEDGDTPKSDAGVRAVPLPAVVVAALRSWRKRQAAEQLAWGPDWPDSGMVFTREDGTPVPAPWMSVRFETLAYRAGLPPVRFHDLRHGAASLCKTAGLDTKFISALPGHSRTSFTDATYVLIFPEVAKAAAESAAAEMPRPAAVCGAGLTAQRGAISLGPGSGSRRRPCPRG